MVAGHRTFVISSSDIERCPVRSLSPRHYREDGSCLCGSRVYFRGTMRGGTGCTGTVPVSTTPAEFAEAKFRAGWTRLSITRGENELGGIGRNDSGRRVWWGEKS